MLGTARARDVFEGMLEQVRLWYGFYVCGDVVMPEHVHLLISEPERGLLSLALQMLKQNIARELRLPEGVSSKVAVDAAKKGTDWDCARDPSRSKSKAPPCLTKKR